MRSLWKPKPFWSECGAFAISREHAQRIARRLQGRHGCRLMWSQRIPSILQLSSSFAKDVFTVVAWKRKSEDRKSHERVEKRAASSFAQGMAQQNAQPRVRVKGRIRP